MSKGDGLSFALGALIVVVLALALFALLVSDTQEFRKSEEGQCLKKIAEQICNERGYTFKKLYTKFYYEDFACVERRGYKIHEFDFYDSERRKCK